jgi:AraC-like DNA-binding protein
MFFRSHTPQPPLSAFLKCIWYSEGFEGTHAQERLLPNGESSIIFDLRERPVCIYSAEDIRKYETFAPSIFCGARTDCFVIDTCQQLRVIGIQFRPGGAFPFLGMPASEVASTTYSLDDVWPGEAALIREELLFAGDVGRMFSILERVLLSRLKESALLDPAVTFAVKKLGQEGVKVRDLADRIGLSSRRFMDRFREQTGLTPKAFQRVRRFQRVLNMLHVRSRDRAEESWAALAADCGYYDQPHFIHDFRTFSGMTPGEYVAAATPHLNHVPLK